MKPWQVVGGSLLLLGGCHREMGYFPLEVGSTWNYSVRSGFATFVEEVKVRRRLAVAETDGVELGGPLGLSRIAWKDGELVADSLPNTRFAPPIVLLVPAATATAKGAKSAPAPTKVAYWHGFVETNGKSRPASAVLSQESASLKLGTRDYATIKATLRLKSGKKTLELISWYAEGMGPLRQEQRVDGGLVVSMEFIAGP